MSYPTIAILILVSAFWTHKAAGQCFPDRVFSFSAGYGAGFGLGYFPQNVLGPPHGNVNPQLPNADERELLSLGVGGSIVLEFSSHVVIDGPGPDFTVFENPFQPIGYPDFVFCETATVSVSTDTISWYTFPFEFDDPGTTAGLYQKWRYRGLAGVTPVFSSPDNGISPYDPNVSGGDSFDLHDLGLTYVKFVKVTDTGTTEISPTVDRRGNIVNDPGNAMNAPPTAGFDLDAVAAIHSSPVATVREDWYLYE
ncbi:MAG: hypothetical protein N2Z21_09370 [Candidatus Sumerlaeaceae bacterium]|nr:hypothetical protein [Candidatus Sumerlaeaceae bacterium]